MTEESNSSDPTCIPLRVYQELGGMYVYANYEKDPRGFRFVLKNRGKETITSEEVYETYVEAMLTGAETRERIVAKGLK